MVHQKRRKALNRMEFKISTDFEVRELVDFLRTIWGDESPLVHVCEKYSGQDQKENTGMYVVIRHANKIVGCAGMKFVNDTQLELGSLAVSKVYRGKGLATELLTWINSIGREQLNLGYSLISYATLGSAVMHFIIQKTNSLTDMIAYPLNIAVGVIPINKDKASENINFRKMVANGRGGLYTSTLAVLSTKKVSIYEKISGFEQYNLESILPVKCFKNDQIEFSEADNTELSIPGTRLVINHIKSTKIRNLPKIYPDSYHQIVIPMINSFTKIHELARAKYVITGFNMINSVLHIVYSNSDCGAITGVLDYLKTLKNDAVDRFSNIIYAMNQR